MNHKLSLFCFLSLFAFSCNNEPGKTDQEKTDAETTHCYAYVNNKDSVLLHVDIKDNVVTGDLTYNFYEKDKNTGTIQGEMKGDTLFAEYSFISEGISSVREVAFLKKGNDFIEGYGDADQVDEKLVFKNRSMLNFSNTVLKQTSCDK